MSGGTPTKPDTYEGDVGGRAFGNDAFDVGIPLDPLPEPAGVAPGSAPALAPAPDQAVAAGDATGRPTTGGGPPGAGRLTGPTSAARANTARVAPTWARVAAAVLDAPAFFAPAVAFARGGEAPFARAAGLRPEALAGIDAFANALVRQGMLWVGALACGLVVAFVYGVVTRALYGRTLGEAALGLRVVDRFGQRPGVVRAAWRGLVAGAGVLFVAAGALWVLVDRERRSWADLAARTWLVRD